MKKLTTATLWVAALTAVASWGQNIRNVTINAESEEGQLLQQAGEQTEPAKKIEMLEQFLSKHESHDAAGWVHLQLQAEYLKTNGFAKSVEHGKDAQKRAPQDVEIAHLLVKGAEGVGDAKGLAEVVENTHALAQKVASSPKPSDSEEAETWKKSVEFAAQVDQYNQHALFSAALKATAPADKALLLEALRKNYPGSQFDKQIDAQYVVIYQQLGQHDKMLQAAEAALGGDPTNEAYLYMLGESYSDPAKGKVPQAQANAQKILEILPNKPKPESVKEEDWARHKATYTGLARSLLGRTLAIQGKFAPAHKELLAAAAALKGSGNDTLAPIYFYLGFSSARLERHRDAVTYLGQAAKIPGPYQAPAQDLLGKIKAALSQK